MDWFATKPSINSPWESLGAPPGSLPGCWGPAPPLPPPTSKALLKANCAAHFPELLLKTHSKTHQKGQSPTVLLVCIRHGCCSGLVSAAERGGGWSAVTVTLRSPAKSLRAAGCGHRCVAQKERPHMTSDKGQKRYWVPESHLTSTNIGVYRDSVPGVWTGTSSMERLGDQSYVRLGCPCWQSCCCSHLVSFTAPI